MRKKPDLYIRFFNEFSISSPYYDYAPSAHNSTQLTLLISYLVANQGTKVSKDVLMNMLWPDIQDKVPVGALRNLVYRARKELEQLYPDRKIDYIKFTQDAYYWNTDLYCKIDIFDFENYRTLALSEPSPEKQYRIYSRMQRLYRGEFLSNHTAISWIHNRCTYYRDLYINCVMNMCEYLYSNQKYSDLISLCDQTIILYSSEEQFYRYKLLAYLGMDMAISAFEFYQSSVNFFFSRYGTDITIAFRDIYQDILSLLPVRTLTLNNFESFFKSDTDINSPYYCNFHVFKSICQIHAHKLHTSSPDTAHILLITLAQAKDSAVPAHGMNIVQGILASCLKQEDIYTKGTLNQFLVLTESSEEEVELLKELIQERFLKENSNDFTISFDSRSLL